MADTSVREVLLEKEKGETLLLSTDFDTIIFVFPVFERIPTNVRQFVSPS